MEHTPTRGPAEPGLGCLAGHEDPWGRPRRARPRRRGGAVHVRAGTHSIELCDALDRPARVTPVLVTDEQSATFMADGVSRTSDTVGVVNVVPGAGVTHCLSGVAEAFMDTVPLVVLACGIRSDTGKAFQLHDLDRLRMLARAAARHVAGAFAARPRER